MISVFKKKSGIIALPTTLLVATIILEISIAGALFSTALTNTRLNERLSAIALSSARSGANDAIIRIIRYKNCPNSDYCPSSYSLDVDNLSGIAPENGATANVTISPNVGGRITVSSVGSISKRNKCIDTVLLVDETTGEVSLESFMEVECVAPPPPPPTPPPPGNNPPVANAGPDQGVIIGETVFFDGSGSTDDGMIVEYEWDFDDGGSDEGVAVSHVYNIAGTYNVSLTVTDDGSPQGLTDSDTLVVVVSDPALPPGSPNVVVDAGSGGDCTWVDSGEVRTNDGVFASCILQSGLQFSNYLDSSDFGFAIPGGATITGIAVEVEACGTPTLTSGIGFISLIKAPGSYFSGSAPPGSLSDTCSTYIAIGGDADLWGTTWTPAEINDPDFGVRINFAHFELQSNTVYVDHIRVTVFTQ